MRPVPDKLEHKVGKLIEFACTMTVYSKTRGKGKRVIGKTQVKVRARVSAWGNNNRFARAEKVDGWAWSSGNSHRRRELTQAFTTATGYRLWHLEAALGFSRGSFIETPTSIGTVSEADKERLRYLPLDKSLGPAPSYSVNACQHCGGTVHTDHDDHGEVRRCMACGRP